MLNEASSPLHALGVDDLPEIQALLQSGAPPQLLLARDVQALVPLLQVARAEDDVALATEPVEALALRQQRLRQREETPRQRDSLTGLPNRAVADARLEALARSEETLTGVHAVVLADIDHFKRVNDMLGHGAGDQVLVRVAQMLSDQVRAADLVARVGGEEFLAVLHRDTPEEMHQTVEQLRLRVAQADWPSVVPGLSTLTLSLGVAYLFPGRDAKALLHQADEALYAAKAGGRNRTVYAETLAANAEDPAALRLQHFENVTRVVTERVANLVSLMGKQMLREMQREAQKDALTGVPNRAHFDRRIARELALSAEDGRALTLLLLDIDHFGRFNREHGITAGDAVLRQFAQTVALAIRPNDWLARYGGEEFCVVMPTSVDEALQAAERLRALVAETPLRGPAGEIFQVTVSIGVARYAGPSETLEVWLLRASKALQAGKQAGRNRVTPAR